MNFIQNSPFKRDGVCPSTFCWQRSWRALATWALTLVLVASLVDAEAKVADDLVEAFNWKSKRLEFSASKGGAGGVIFVKDGARKKTLVLKFVGEDPAAILLADRMLAEVGVPVADSAIRSQIRRLTPGAPAQKTTFESIVEKVKTAAQGSADARLKAVYERTVPTATAVLVQEFLRGVGKLSDLGQIFQVPHEGPAITAMKREDLAKNFKEDYADYFAGVHAWFKAIETPSRQGRPRKRTLPVTLGRMYVMDAFLGNEDRLQTASLNVSNLMLTEDAGLKAIDSISYAPSFRLFAKHKGAIGLLDDLSVPLGTVEKHPVKLSKADWVQALINVDWKGGGEMLRDGTSALTSSNLELTPPNRPDKRYGDFYPLKLRAESARITARFRDVSKNLIEDLRKLNPEICPRKSDGLKGVKITDEVTNTFPQEAPTWKLQVLDRIEGPPVRVHGKRYQIDWSQFEQAVTSGMTAAMDQILRMKFDQGFQNKHLKAFDARGDVMSLDALTYRQIYWKQRKQGWSPEEAIKSVLSQVKNANAVEEQSFSYKVSRTPDGTRAVEFR